MKIFIKQNLFDILAIFFTLAFLCCFFLIIYYSCTPASSDSIKSAIKSCSDVRSDVEHSLFNYEPVSVLSLHYYSFSCSISSDTDSILDDQKRAL